MKLRSTLRSRVIVALAMAAGLALCVRGGAGIDGLLCVAPALLLALALLARRYPGERLLLAALAGRSRHRRRRAQPRAHRSSRGQGDGRVPRGGLLIAFALAVRPPPAAPAAS